MKNSNNEMKWLGRPKVWLVLMLGVLLTACSEDFLDKSPQDSVAAESFFHTAADLQTYVNGMYSRLAPQYNTQGGTGYLGGGNSNIGLDLNSDTMIFQTSITSSLYRWSTASVAPDTDGYWRDRYTNIRQDNYFLHYADLNAEKTDAAKHYIGEVYFFRAWDYYNLLSRYGGVPIVTNLLTDLDTEQLFKPRDSRYDVAKQIISDLDKAISMLSWKGSGEAAIEGRINKESAITLKARVALFEGTWEYYHGKKSTAFAVSGRNGLEFLEMVEPAVQELINHQGTAIYTAGGNKTKAYNQLFAQDNVSKIDGVFLYKVYDASKLTLSHNFFFKILDSGPSITNHLVDMYLNNDGSQQLLTGAYAKTLNTLSTSLDPRFRQTVWTPDRGPQNKLEGRGGDGDPFRYPIIASQAPYTSIGFTSTGYRNFKGAVLAQQATKGETDDILMRYEEPLLCYAEAKAILGKLTQADLDKTVNVIRNRVGMVPMNVSAGSTFTYDETYGFDLAESPLVNEIRRERSVEFALEGFRLDDLKRWAVYDKVINGYQPKGAMLQEFVDYFKRTPAQVALDAGTNEALWSQIRKDGYLKNEFSLVLGTNIQSYANGRMNPWFKNIDFQPGGRGLFIEPKRDYLSPIPLQEIKLYGANNAQLAQNPGWN
jgi:hypothetical protein